MHRFSVYSRLGEGGTLKVDDSTSQRRPCTEYMMTSLSVYLAKKLTWFSFSDGEPPRATSRPDSFRNETRNQGCNLAFRGPCNFSA